MLRHEDETHQSYDESGEAAPLTKHMHTATASYTSHLQKHINLRFKINKTKQTDLQDEGHYWQT